METRAKRAARSCPMEKTVGTYTIKKNILQSKSFTQAPCRPRKKEKYLSRCFSMVSQFTPAKPVYFLKPASLSCLYNVSNTDSYLDQMFWSLEAIGQGSFGEVFKMRSKEDGRLYAIKRMLSTHSVRYAYAEVRNYEKAGDFPYFVKFILAWEEASIVYIQMEFCYISLDKLSAQKHVMEEQQLWEILYDICLALNYLNTKKLVHLDVKPANIMMTRDCYKLADFGLLVDLNEHDGRKISTLSDGDAKYLACEVLNGVYTYSCDIFGLGISLLELSTNIELPEFGPLWHQIRSNSLPNIFYENVSYELAMLVERMMANSYKKRLTADKILVFPSVLNFASCDSLDTRHNYYASLFPNGNQPEDDIVYVGLLTAQTETPRRPLKEITDDAPMNEVIQSPLKSGQRSFDKLPKKNLFG